MKHGLYTAEAIETRRMVRESTRQARELVETNSRVIAAALCAAETTAPLRPYRLGPTLQNWLEGVVALLLSCGRRAFPKMKARPVR